ncbi:hypothetical protein NYO12_21370 [Klebsiella variicola]|uniref:hypothetical protein n=1 Tax=Klebsiella variicola TaxID=244366 RepID=UPI0021686B15|nr:hypothetical protein [Klebsiella variicola]UVW51686.1 hypothetical protein NYO12_21370 [Klebsiella variicola]
MKNVPGFDPETRNFRIAQLINQQIYQPVRDVTVALVLAGKSESEILEAAGITARVILKTLRDHLGKGGQTPHCEGE